MAYECHQYILRALRDIWRLKWDNQRKEVFWHLLLDAMPTASRYGHLPSCPCGRPGSAVPGRKHHFWECGASQAVVQAVCTAGGLQMITCEQVWIMRNPLEGTLFTPVWRVVCLAALQAMWHASRALQLPVRRAKLADHPDGVVAAAGQVGVSKFWELLEEFARVGRPPRKWLEGVGAGGMFLYFDSGSARWRVRRAPS